VHKLSDHELQFFSTAAQVLPVLMLALAVELRTARALGFSMGARGSGGWKIVLWVIFGLYVVMSAGELIALTALQNGEAAGSADTWVILALLGGLVALFLGALDRVLPTVVSEAMKTAPAAEQKAPTKALIEETDSLVEAAEKVASARPPEDSSTGGEK